MATQPDLDSLTSKEKETLRLILRGHDAKSMARELGLSVHTINDRLRCARRKLEVTSSREAARLLGEHERAAPENFADKDLGGVPDEAESQTAKPSNAGHPDQRKPRIPLIRAAGAFVMITLAVAIALATAGSFADKPVSEEIMSSRASETDAVLETAARDWLELVDASDWQASYDAAGQAFQEPNTVATWRDASEMARIPLGDVATRKLAGVQFLNAPPGGYQVVRFRTDFANRNGVTEHVTLEKEGDVWKVVGYFLT